MSPNRVRGEKPLQGHSCRSHDTVHIKLMQDTEDAHMCCPVSERAGGRRQQGQGARHTTPAQSHAEVAMSPLWPSMISREACESKRSRVRSGGSEQLGAADDLLRPM